MFFKRSRMVYGIMIAAVMLLGLGTRIYSNVMPGFVRSYIGDVLWALMVFFIIGFLFRTWSTIKTAGASALFCLVIEVSQLYHAPWIDSIRDTRLGGLILGYGFLWSDLICYTAGILMGIFIETVIIKRIQRYNINNIT